MSDGESNPPAAPILRFFSVWLGASWIVVGSLVHPLIPGGWAGVAVLFGASMIPAFLLVRALGGDAYPTASIRRLVFRPFWYALLWMPLLAIVTVCSWIGILLGVPRTTAIWILAATIVVLCFASIAGYLGTQRLITRHLSVSLPNLPNEFDGLRVVQISDLHVGPQTSTAFLARVAATVLDANPDLIAITGDQVDDFDRDTALFAAAFGHLAAPLGVFVVPGNHDIYAGWNAVREGLSAIGFTVLVNEAVPVVRAGHRFWLGGTGDPAGHSWARHGGAGAAPDIAKTLRAVPPNETAIVLAHNPALWPALAEHGVDLTLSGHTHYGQLAVRRLGWNLAGMFIHPSMGAHRLRNALLYINPGTNFWGPPFRLGTPPEVTVLVLARGERAEVRSAHPDVRLTD